MPRRPVRVYRTIPAAAPVELQGWRISALRWGRWTHPPGYQHPALVDAVPHLVWVESGGATAYLGEECFKLSAGTLAFVPEKRVLFYRVDAQEPFRHCTLHFNMITEQGVSLAQVNAVPRCIHPREPERIEECLAVISTEIGGKSLASYLRACSALMKLLSIMIEARGMKVQKVGQPHGKAYEALAIMEEHLQRPLSVKELAARLQISPEHVARVFRQTFGLSPKHQIRNLQMRWAGSLLMATDKPVKAIAGELGYRSPQVFERAFHKFSGYAPLVWRGQRLKTTPGAVCRYRPLPKRLSPGSNRAP